MESPVNEESDRQSFANELDDFAITPVDGKVPLCGGCSSRGICRLGVREVAYENEDEVTVRAVCDPAHRGGPTVAHGGWIAAIFDDALAHAVLRENSRVVTRDLTVRFRRPVPVSAPLLIAVKILERREKVWTVGAQMLLDTSSRPVLATASADFVARPEDHYERHRRWLDEAAAPRHGA
ncbi:PaaI family thioesterase [Rhodococcus aetherivorans]